jgi:hypothetical protein
MHGCRGPKYCPQSVIGTPQQTIKIRRGGMGKLSGSGPSGWKLRPARVLSKSLSEMASKYHVRGRSALQAKRHGSGTDSKALQEAIKEK